MQVQSTEEGMQSFEELVRHYSHSCLWWLGPWCPIMRLFHPEAIKPVLQASGNQGQRALGTIWKMWGSWGHSLGWAGSTFPEGPCAIPAKCVKEPAQQGHRWRGERTPPISHRWQRYPHPLGHQWALPVCAGC